MQGDMDAPPPQRPRSTHPQGQPGGERRGFIIGLSGGLGGIFCTDCDTLIGGAGTFHIGGMINPTVALMYDSAAVVYDAEFSLLTSSVGTFAVQRALGQRGWIKGGVGIGALVEDCCAEAGLGLMGGAGLEVLQRRRFTLDLQGRITATKFEEAGYVNSFMFNLGVNWY